MLDVLRRGSTGLVAKALLFLLIISFAVWGVADVFRGFGQGSLAKVGGTEISTADFQRTYQSELNALSQQFGRRLTPEQARMFGLEQRVLSQLIGATAVETHAKELGLAVSSEVIVDEIRKAPALQGPDGKFNRIALDAFLREAGLSEQALIQQRQKDSVREQVSEALLLGLVPPRPMIEVVHGFREETRVVEHFTLDPKTAVSVPDPDDAKLKETYEQNKRQFVTPESRRLAVLMLTLETVRSRFEITDAEVRSAWEATRTRYDTPERRRIEQIPFKDKAEAVKARAAIAKGQSFLDAAKAAGAAESDVQLGMLTKAQMIDSAIADAAFQLAKDKVSDPVEGRFTTVLLRVTEIEAGKQPGFEEVKARVQDGLAREKAGPLIQKLHDEVDDRRGAGKPLRDIAAEMKLVFTEIAATDRGNKTADGKTAFDHPDAERIIAQAFAGAVGIETETVELGDGGYAWVDVVAVTPEAERPLDAVKADVKALYLETERRRLLNALAGRLADRVSAGESLEAVAKEAAAKVDRTNPFNRTTTPQGLSANAVQQAFAIPKGKAGTADSADRASRTVLRVVEVTAAPAPTSEQAERIGVEIARQMQGDVIASYVSALQDRLGVSINQSVLSRLTGAGGAQ